MELKCTRTAILGYTYTKGHPAIAAVMGSYAAGFSRGYGKISNLAPSGASAPLFERADCTAVKTAKAKEEDRTTIEPLEKSYVSTETGQVQ